MEGHSFSSFIERSFGPMKDLTQGSVTRHLLLVLTLIAYLAPAALIRIFSSDPRVIAFGSDYLRIVSLNFVSAGIVFTTSSVFQGIGNTLPPLFSSMSATAS